MIEIKIMKLRAAFVLSSCLLAACEDRGTPPEAYVHWQDRLEAATGLPLFGFGGPCYHWHQDELGGYYEPRPNYQCYKMDPPRRWSGLWRNEFEASRFCPAPARNCGLNSNLRLDASIPFPEAIKKRRYGGLYAMEFVGRRQTYARRYGDMGDSSRDIIVDRLISIREVEAPPKPSQADLEGMKEGCRKIPNCSVEELVKTQTE